MTMQQASIAVPGKAATARKLSFWEMYAQFVRLLVYALVAVAGVGICVMVVVTCLEVVLRVFRVPLTGVLDVVKIAGAVTMAGALPYTTACKGHVAIEYFFQKLSRRPRAILDAVTRMCVLGLFGLLAKECLRHAGQMRASGQLTQTLKWPEFWVAYVLAFACAVVCLVKIYHLFHPGKELIKP